MIKGIGCDIIDVSRMERAMEKERFLEKVFTPNERELIKNGSSAQSAAGMWAAKEAVVKALGTGFSGCPPAAVSVEQGPQGEPVVRLGACAAAAAGDRIHITISHEGEYAAAFAVVEGGCP